MSHIVAILANLLVILNLGYTQKCTLSFTITLTPTNICYDITGKFPHLNPLYSLNCVNCNLPNIQGETFSWFRGEVLNVSASNVSKISENAFEKFSPHMKKFIFESNRLESINTSLFQSFKNLSIISFRNNQLARLKPRQFRDVSVALLDLSLNEIDGIGQVFEGLRYTVLDLSNNRVAEIGDDAFTNSFAKEIHLGGNNISILYPGSFRGLKSLESLNLAGNTIEYLPDHVFASLTSLRSLDLSKNRLTNLNVNALAGLVSLLNLDVSHNQLSHINETLLSPLSKLTSLNVSQNYLTRLNLGVILKQNPYLARVTINDNFWVCKELVAMDRSVGPTIGGFAQPAKHYNVPNLHGIACSRTPLLIGSFDEFLEVISGDVQELYVGDYQRFEGPREENAYLKGIFYLLLLITLILVMFFLNFVLLDRLVLPGCVRSNPYEHFKEFRDDKVAFI